MAGGTYNIPRDYKGEGKILYIFSTKGLIFTGIGVIIGVIFFYIFRLIGLGTVGFVIMLVFAFLGFAIATFKIPDSNKFEFTIKTGGESIDTVILRYIKFKRKNKRIYVYKDSTKEEVK